MYPHNDYVDREDGSSDEEQNSYDYYVDQTQQFANEHDDIDHQFQRLEISDERPEHDSFSPCNTPNEESHFAYKDVFYHEDAGQHFHIECHECINYMNQSGFEIPPEGYKTSNTDKNTMTTTITTTKSRTTTTNKPK